MNGSFDPRFVDFLATVKREYLDTIKRGFWYPQSALPSKAMPKHHP
jgi:hypothetical protein